MSFRPAASIAPRPRWRILLISDDPGDPTVGASKVPLQLQAAFRDLGHHCDVLFREDLGRWPRAERLRWLAGPWLAWRAAARAWRLRGPYDVMDVASAEGWVIGWARRWGGFRFEAPTRLAAQGPAPMQGPALVMRSHGLEHVFYRELVADHAAGMLRKPWWRRGWYPLLRLSQVGLACRLADRLILLNARERQVARQRNWQPPSRIELIPLAVAAERWEAAPPPEAPRGAGVLFSGAWYTAKGNHYLARAHGLLMRRGQPVPLTLLGGGIGLPFAEVERRVRAGFAPESQPWLTVLPRLRDEDAVFAQYRRHDLLVCPSTAEGFGLVVFEALSQRLPVVCTSATGASELLRHAEHAWIVPPRDPEALAEAIALLWQNPVLRRGLAERGYQHVREFSWRQTAEQTLAGYAAARAGMGPLRK